MARIEYVVVMVDRWSAKVPPSARKLAETGIPLKIVADWQKVRRSMSPAGLRRKARECRN